MTNAIIKQRADSKNVAIGNKAANLFRMADMGIRVPKFIVIPAELLLSLAPAEIWHSNYKDAKEIIQQIDIPQQVMDSITVAFPGEIFFAVRSSAIDEDGKDFSFAGQFESFLFVKKEQLAGKIKDVWASLFSDRVMQYRKNNNISTTPGIAVIIQEMIDAAVSGVAFGVNPLNGNKNEKWINSVFGLGHGLVSGELNADQFVIDGGTIKKQVAKKAYRTVMASESLGGIKQIAIGEEKQELPGLTDEQVLAIGIMLERLDKEYGMPQDIEFAIKDDTLFLLQTRPVTTFSGAANTAGSYTVWDNSNIIESYPGVTTPLTFSFISQSYEGAYKLFCRYMGISPNVIRTNDRVFKNTLGLINGRVYYNLKTWYHMLAMAPGYNINARFMENMMGVKERFDIPESYRLSKRKAWWQIMKMAGAMYLRYLSLPRKRKEFIRLLNTTIADYKQIDFDSENANELMHLYLAFEKKLLNEWKAPLLNDFFAMVAYGMLQKRCNTYLTGNNPNIHNDLLCGSSDIISTQPIHRCIDLATVISADKELKELFTRNNETLIWNEILTNDSEKFCSLKNAINAYIADFGERCIGELKLETVSYSQEPSKFIRLLKSYVETGITNADTSRKTEEGIRKNAERELAGALKDKWLKKLILRRTLKTARTLVSARENLRYERTRAFGMVRKMFSAIGKKFYSDNILESDRDIFYLTKEEIFSFIEGTSVTQNIKALTALRKKEFDNYKKQPAPSERFSTYGPVYHANDFYNTDKVEKEVGGLKGIGCCPGIVRGKAKVISNPDNADSVHGQILVTSSTDPGWVTLFPGALGIITERGSVLSHSAIVSREMGKPCIVGVSHLLKTVKTGDEIEMNGSTGSITIVRHNE